MLQVFFGSTTRWTHTLSPAFNDVNSWTQNGVGRGSWSRLRLRADAVRHEGHRLAEDLLQLLRHRGQGELRHHVPVRPACSRDPHAKTGLVQERDCLGTNIVQKCLTAPTRKMILYNLDFLEKCILADLPLHLRHFVLGGGNRPGRGASSTPRSSRRWRGSA